MAKYRQRPPTIEATQWNQLGDHPKVKAWDTPNPDFMVQFEYHTACTQPKEAHGQIVLDNGWFLVCPHDWIVTGENEVFYPMQNDSFNATYELVPQEAI